MNPLAALFLVVGLVAVATVAGVVVTRRPRRARTVASGSLDVSGLGVQFGSSATVVLFSTEFCARCPAAKRLLRTVTAEASGVSFAEVDLTHRPDVASALHILQTPTTFVLDAAGSVRARFGGVVTRHAVTHQIHLITGAPHARS